MTRNEINALNEAAIRRAICPICQLPIGALPHSTIHWNLIAGKAFSGWRYVHTACVPKDNIAQEATNV